MDFKIKVLRIEDLDLVLRLAKKEFQKVEFPSEMDRELASWHEPWRQEALEHYLPLGWCFGCWSDDRELLGFFLAQPILFFKGLTQNLWVEFVCAVSNKIEETLVDVAYRTSREKHLQKVYFNNPSFASLLKDKYSATLIEDTILEVKTAKY